MSVLNALDASPLIRGGVFFLFSETQVECRSARISLEAQCVVLHSITYKSDAHVESQILGGIHNRIG